MLQALGANAPFIDRETGSITYPLDRFTALVGFGGSNLYFNAQNIGMVQTHFKLTFTNVEP